MRNIKKITRVEIDFVLRKSRITYFKNYDGIVVFHLFDLVDNILGMPFGYKLDKILQEFLERNL